MPSPPESITTSSVASSPSLSTFDEIASIQEPRKPCEQVPSFAEMLRNTNTRKSSNAWPSVTSAQSRTYPGAALKGSSDEENGYISIPSSSQSFGDAFARAFEQTKLLESGIIVIHKFIMYFICKIYVYLIHLVFFRRKR